jgi:hypothetical protein
MGGYMGACGIAGGNTGMPMQCLLAGVISALRELRPWREDKLV